jgi:biotin carboxylase
MTEKRLLILGSAEDFVKLTQYAVKRGIYTVVADARWGEAKKFATKSYTVNLEDYELIDQIIREEKIDHVLTSYSDILFEMMVKISERNKLPCYCTEIKMRYLRDKFLMKQMLEKLGIKTQKAQLINSVELEEKDIQIPYPCVIKPLDSWGSRGLRIVHNFEEVQSCLKDCMQYSTAGNSVLLECINYGYELNVMSWVKDGKIFLMEFGDRETTGMTVDVLPHQAREIFPSVFYYELENEVRQLLKKIAGFCGIKEGPLSMQFFYENGEIYVGEVTGRFFGCHQGIMPVINGIDLNELLVNMIYFPEENNVILKKEKKALDHYTIALYLLPEKGVVKSFGNVMSFKNEHCDEFTVYIKPNVSTSMETWIARIYAHFKTREEADAYTENLYSNMFVPGLDGKNLVMPNKLTQYDGKKWKKL